MSVPLYGLRPTQATMGTGQGLLGGLGQETIQARQMEQPKFEFNKQSTVPQFQPSTGGGTAFAGAMQQGEPTAAMRAARGAMGLMSGAGSGAAAGTALGGPGLGTAAGAIIGGVLGGAMGVFG